MLFVFQQSNNGLEIQIYIAQLLQNCALVTLLKLIRSVNIGTTACVLMHKFLSSFWD